jgi:alpha-D-xyloside xylohydrolase
MNPRRMHNFYAFLYNKIIYEAVSARYGPTESVLFARTATAGSQRFPLCWGGDCESTAAALAESIRGGLSFGLSGFSYWSCDIGGFEGSPASWIYKRWVAFGLFCSHSRLHGSNSYRVPWLIDDDNQGPEGATAVLRHFVRIKRSLMPYLYAQSIEAAENGWPTSLRAMCLEFPEDPTSWFLDRQFMIGSDILVAPVFTADGNVQFYLPPGKWTSFWNDGNVVQGPCWRSERHGFNSLPVYVRENTVLVLGQGNDYKNEGFGHDWCLQGGVIKLYHTTPGTKAKVIDSNGRLVQELVVSSDGGVEISDVLKGEWKVIDITG